MMPYFGNGTLFWDLKSIDMPVSRTPLFLQSCRDTKQINYNVIFYFPIEFIPEKK